MKITPTQKRQLSIVLSDYINNRPAGVSDDEYYPNIGKMISMAAGTIDYEPIISEYHVVKPAETGDKTYIAWFTARADNMRAVKLLLQASFELMHFPQAKEIPGEEGYKRFRVMGVTKEAAQQVLAENKNLLLRVSFNDTNREESGVAAPTTLPRRGRRKNVVITPQTTVEIPAAPEVVELPDEEENVEEVEENASVEEVIDAIADIIEKQPEDVELPEAPEIAEFVEE